MDSPKFSFTSVLEIALGVFIAMLLVSIFAGARKKREEASYSYEQEEE